MKSLYNINGLMFWDDRSVHFRDMFKGHFAITMAEILRGINPAFKVYGCETPTITPRSLINPNYTDEDIFVLPDGLALRPETTMGSYLFASDLLTSNRTTPPLCVWQAGKSYRKEQDQVTKNMRLKEFWQQEFQCIYTEDTANDYHSAVLDPVRRMIGEVVGLPTRIVASDRLPGYSQVTSDIEVDNGDKWMEVASISRRTDFPIKATFQTKKGAVEKALLVVEVAIGLDRCVYNFLQRAERQ